MENFLPERSLFHPFPQGQPLNSIDRTPGGKTGDSMNISPNQNQQGRAYTRGGTVRDLHPFKGYRVVMEHPDTLYGFRTTPIAGRRYKCPRPVP
jgi:hypothetical protein